MMTDEEKYETCQQCGATVAVPDIVIDEETGRHLCRICALEQESCGCSDEGDE